MLLLLFSAAPLSARELVINDDRDPRLTSWRPSAASAIRAQDQVWLISTRHLPYPLRASDEVAVRVSRFDPSGSWLPATFDEFVASGEGSPITIFSVHGNRVEAHEAIERGWFVYNALTRLGADERPLRFVIWSWPSDQICGPVHDVRVKAWRTEAEGYYLGWTLSRVASQGPMSLVGYSYGARIISGALHVLGGGSLVGLSVPDEQLPVGTRARVALMVAAMPNHWLLPGHAHGRALEQIDRLLLLYNSMDPVLKRYHIVDACPGYRPQALGLTGVFGTSQLGPLAERLDQANVSGTIGRSHDVIRYYQAPHLMDAIRRYVLWEPVDG